MESVIIIKYRLNIQAVMMQSLLKIKINHIEVHLLKLLSHRNLLR